MLMAEDMLILATMVTSDRLKSPICGIIWDSDGIKHVEFDHHDDIWQTEVAHLCIIWDDDGIRYFVFGHHDNMAETIVVICIMRYEIGKSEALYHRFKTNEYVIIT